VKKFKPVATPYLCSRRLADQLDKARKMVEQASERVHRSRDLIIASKKAVARARDAASTSKKPA
jgi:hypothetical protein